ncbi:MAG: hypothetical protein KAI93_15655, partial [Desulfobacterales bacterium]|nr:hypothetical protein [Desulfobacterales bacterium]
EGLHTILRKARIFAGTGLMEVKEYVRSNEDLKMGKAQLDSIVYAFIFPLPEPTLKMVKF